MSVKGDPLFELEAAERAYLRARGWTQPDLPNGGLWADPWNPKKRHTARIAAGFQRARDAAGEAARPVHRDETRGGSR